VLTVPSEAAAATVSDATAKMAAVKETAVVQFFEVITVQTVMPMSRANFWVEEADDHCSPEFESAEAMALAQKSAGAQAAPARTAETEL